MFTSFTCKSAVCVCRTPGDRARDGDREDLQMPAEAHNLYASNRSYVLSATTAPKFCFTCYYSYHGEQAIWPLFQNEGRCSAFDMEIIFHSHTNKTHFYKKGCASSLILKVRVFGTRKWPVAQGCCLLACITSSEFITNTKLVCHFNDRLFSAVATGTGNSTPSGPPVRHFVFFRLRQNVIFD